MYLTANTGWWKVISKKKQLAMYVTQRCRHLSLFSRLCTKATYMETTTVVDRSRSAMCWFCTSHNSLHVDFACFKLALWPTLRLMFMNFWSFLISPGDKHNEKISNCSSTPKLVQARDFLPFLTIRLLISFFSEISFWNEMFLCSIKTEMFTVAES